MHGEDLGRPIVPEAPTRLWLPGLGVVDLRVRKVARAVKEYDERLNLARHEETGDWVCVIGEQGHPVFGFGRELPDPYDVPRILARYDIKRNGKRILDQLNRRAELLRKEEEYRGDQRDEALTEHFEHAFRKVGKHPVPRIFVPRGFRGRK